MEFDAADWDRQFEADVQTGKLDALADRALRDHAAGLTTKLWLITHRPALGSEPTLVLTLPPIRHRGTKASQRR